MLFASNFLTKVETKLDCLLYASVTASTISFSICIFSSETGLDFFGIRGIGFGRTKDSILVCLAANKLLPEEFRDMFRGTSRSSASPESLSLQVGRLLLLCSFSSELLDDREFRPRLNDNSFIRLAKLEFSKVPT